MSKCLFPIRLKSGQLVPCGRCYQCRSRKRAEWSFRVQQQLQQSKSCFFCRLSYSDETLGDTLVPYYVDDYGEVFQPLNDALSQTWSYVRFPESNKIKRFNYEKLPDTLIDKVIPVSDLSQYTEIKYIASVNKQHCQLFLDKFQHYFKRKHNTQLKFFLCAEYGEQYSRPHYHVIFLFDKYIPYDDRKFQKLLELQWKYGFCDVQLPDSNSCITYMQKYLCKGSVVPEGALNPFSLKSKGLGKEWILNSENYNYVKYNLLYSDSLSCAVSFQDTCKKIPLPRYYQQKVLDRELGYNKMYYNVAKNSLNKDRDTQDLREKFLAYYDKYLRQIPLSECTIKYFGYKVNLTDLAKFKEQYSGYHTIMYMDKISREQSKMRESDGE